MRGQEIVTGCELLNGYRELRTAMTTRKHPIDPDCPAWRPYVEAHEIGMPPWGGFGRKFLHAPFHFASGGLYGSPLKICQST